MTTRDKYVAAVSDVVGKPYRWGGKGPDAFDCSGVVTYCMRAAGAHINDHNAAEIAQRFFPNKVDNRQIIPGCLLFYGDSPQKITHVMACIERWSNGTIILAGARGGGPDTLTDDIARKQRAFVDVCFGDYWWTKFQFAVDPFM
jgi:cell wall-associated NlpC family hydrolase